MKKLTINQSNKRYYSDEYIKGWEDGVKAQYEATKDAVEVVRCKECKWSDWYKALNGGHRCYCMMHGTCCHTDDDYCSYGERGESEA